MIARDSGILKSSSVRNGTCPAGLILRYHSALCSRVNKSRLFKSNSFPICFKTAQTAREGGLMSLW